MIDMAVTVAVILLGVALLLNAWRLFVGPDATDRILALDTLISTPQHLSCSSVFA